MVFYPSNVLSTQTRASHGLTTRHIAHMLSHTHISACMTSHKAIMNCLPSRSPGICSRDVSLSLPDCLISVCLSHFSDDSLLFRLCFLLLSCLLPCSDISRSNQTRSQTSEAGEGNEAEEVRQQKEGKENGNGKKQKAAREKEVKKARETKAAQAGKEEQNELRGKKDDVSAASKGK